MLIIGHLRVDDAVDRGSRGTVRAGDLSKGLSMLAVPDDGGAVEIERPAPDVTAFEPGPPHAGAYPLDDQVAFKLGDRADDDHDGPARRAARVDILPEADVLDVEPAQFVQNIEEVLD